MLIVGLLVLAAAVSSAVILIVQNRGSVVGVHALGHTWTGRLYWVLVAGLVTVAAYLQQVISTGRFPAFSRLAGIILDGGDLHPDESFEVGLRHLLDGVNTALERASADQVTQRQPAP